MGPRRATKRAAKQQSADLTQTIANADALEIMTPQELMRQHLTDAMESEEFQCSICDKVFPKLYYLQKHQLTHNDRIYNCDQCDKAFKTIQNLNSHAFNVHTEKTKKHLKEKCSFCERRFRFRCARLNHERVHTGEKPNKCSECGKSFSALYSLQTHLLIHTGEKPFACTHCAYRCRDSSTLRKHTASHGPPAAKLACQICDKVFSLKRTLEAHLTQDHLGKDTKVKCHICKKCFRTRDTLTNHIRQVHKRSNSGHCSVCNKYIPNLGNLKAHLATHSDERPHLCPFDGCGKRFKTKSDMLRHEIRHYPEKFYECDECNRKFPRKSRVASHIRTVHNKRKHLKCNVCGDRFYGKNYLARHVLRKHSDTVQKYSCDGCPFVTSNKPLLVSHIRKHNNERDLFCNICKIDFKYKDYAYLKNHYWKIHKIRYKPVHGRVVNTRNSNSTIKEEPDYASGSNIQVTVIKEEILDEEETVVQAISLAEEITLPMIFQEPDKAEVTSYHSKSPVSVDLAKSLHSSEKEPSLVYDAMSFNDFLAKNLSETENSASNFSTGMLEDSDKESDTMQQKASNISGDLAKSPDTEKEPEIEPESFEEFIEKHVRTRNNGVNGLDNPTLESIRKRKSLKQYQIELLERKERKIRKRQKMFAEREALAGARREYNERIMAIAKKMAEKEMETQKIKNCDKNEDSTDTSDVAQNNNTNLTDDSTNTDGPSVSTETETAKTDDGSVSIETSTGENNLKMTIKDGKVQFNKSQCYVCLKLFDTKEKLIEHCAEHFDVCNVSMLRKCPLCDYVSTNNFRKHMKSVHKLNLRVHCGNVLLENEGSFSQRISLSKNKNITSLEVIPSVKILNKRFSMKIDAERRNLKKQGTLKENLVKKGSEWVVEKSLQHIDYEKFLLPLDSAIDVNMKTPKLGYLEKMTRLNNLAKKEGYKILFPCDVCEQVCTALAALKAHYNVHNPRPKKKRTNHPLILARKNKKKTSNADLKSFFEKHIKGGELDFLEFSKVYDKVDRMENVDSSDVE